MFWLGEQRGYMADWITQQWVRFSGKRIDLERDPWLEGPVGNTSRIGKDYFVDLAHDSGLVLRQGDTEIGLLRDFDALAWDELDTARVNPGVRHFYERTAAYDLDAWAQWSGIFRPFGGLLAAIFSRRLQQLNVPLSGLDTSKGITSEVIQLVDASSGDVRYTAWVRELVGSGNVLYAGSYSLCRVPNYPGLCVKVVFPLPNGNGIVIMQPTVNEDGSMTVESAGNRIGDPGFYFTVRASDGRMYAKYLRALRESIYVYEADKSDVRADHKLTLWGQTFLRLHYHLRLKREEGFVLSENLASKNFKLTTGS